MCNLAQQSALRFFDGDEIGSGAAMTGDDELVEATFKQGACCMHVSDTCRIGSDDGAVLDRDLTACDVRNLRLADASIIPSLVSGITNGPVMTLHWHAAARIKTAWRHLLR